jgi:hypothetical protein
MRKGCSVAKRAMTKRMAGERTETLRRTRTAAQGRRKDKDLEKWGANSNQSREIRQFLFEVEKAAADNQDKHRQTFRMAPWGARLRRLYEPDPHHI